MTQYEIKYPIYIPSKTRYGNRALTANNLLKYDIDFKLVIEEQEYDLYKKTIPEDKLLVLPFSNMGSVIPARNWIKQHSISIGAKRHWQLDDNMSHFYRVYGNNRLYIEPKIPLSMCEEFTDRYENIAISGIEYYMFGFQKKYAYTLNTRIYSCSLINNSIPFEWRGQYNEDADLCLQCLSTGYWTTVLINAFLVKKMPTMVIKGGNTASLYQGDGRVKMSRSLERLWPHVVTTERKFGRAQHKIKNNWQNFDNQLIRRRDLNWDEIENKKYDMQLKQVDVLKSKRLKKIVEEHNGEKHKANKRNTR